MKTRFSSLLCSLVLLSFLSSCDIVEPPYSETPTTGGNDTVIRKVLLEEFTGHKCGNCPPASALAHQLKETDYKDKVVVISIHAGTLAKPSPIGAGKYESDYRIPEGEQLFNDFLFTGVPNGMVDRMNNGTIIDYQQWNSKIAQRLALAPEAKLSLATTYNAVTRQANVSVEATYLTDATDQEYLTVYAIEDSIIDWQKDYALTDPDIPNYAHRDMLRGVVNGLYGERLSTATITQGTKFTKNYTYTLSPNFNPTKFSFVAFLYRKDNKEIRQVEEIHLGQ